MLDVKIIAPTRQSSWLENLSVVRKKNGEIRNKARAKTTFHTSTTLNRVLLALA